MEVVVSMAGKGRGLAFRSSSFPGTHASSSRLSVIYFLGVLRAILGTPLRACSSTVSDFNAGASPWWGKQTAKKKHQHSRNGGVQDCTAVRHALLIDGRLRRKICPICAVSRAICLGGIPFVRTLYFTCTMVKDQCLADSVPAPVPGQKPLSQYENICCPGHSGLIETSVSPRKVTVGS